MKLNQEINQDEKFFENWPEAYYQIDNIDERERLLLAHIDKTSDSQDQERYRIFQKRYGKTRDNQRIDYFMRSWAMIPVIFQNINSFFGKKKVREELLQYYEDFGVFDEENEYLKEEWHTFAKKLIHDCATDQRYNTVFFGIGHISEEGTAKKILSEIDRITGSIPKELGIEEDCDSLRKIFFQNYVQMIPNGQDYLSDIL